MKILRLGPNLTGRDFVVGDIHGSYSCVARFLEEIKFDKTKDRLIGVGDLIDRGPENEKCLNLLYEPWFYMVKGNHEYLMECFFEGDPIGLYFWGPNGGRWGIQYLNDFSNMGMFVRDTAKEKLPQLPLLITVEKRDGGVFHVLHAEVWDTNEINDERLKDENELHRIATRQTSNGDAIMWARFMFSRLYNNQLDVHSIEKFKRGSKLEKLNKLFNPRLSHIYSGHTILRKPVQFYGQTNLDTMAYASYEIPNRHGPGTPDSWCGLTVTEPETGKFWFVNDRVFREVQPVVINSDE